MSSNGWVPISLAHQRLDAREKAIRAKEIELTIKYARFNQILAGTDPLRTTMLYETVNALFGKE